MNPGTQPFNPPPGVVGQLNAQMNSGQPALNQVTSQSPNFQPSMQTPPPAPMPEKSPMAKFAKGLAQRGKPATPEKPKNALSDRADLIVKALTNHLAQLDKLMAPQTPQTI